MARWSQAQFNEVIARGRIDGEYHSHIAKSVENWLKKSAHELYKLRDCCKRITSGHTPLRHDLSIGSVYFVTVECVSPLLINYELTKRVETQHYVGELSRVALDDTCVVVTIKRRIAQASPCNNLKGRTLVNQDVAVLRLHEDWIPGFIAAYLVSKFGQNFADRERTEQMNPYLPVNKLGNLLIPRINHEAQKEVDTLIRKRFESLAASESAYTQAQQLLEFELGLDKLSFQKPMGYTAKLSETLIGGRFDADYFQTPFRQIQSHLDRLETAHLFQLVEFIKGIEVGSKAYVISGAPFLRVSNIKEKEIELSPSDKYISGDLYNLLSDYQPQVGELLLTKDGTAGVCFAVDEEVNGIISGGIVRLLPRRDDIPNEYLALVINSRACRMQVEQECSGALILHWKPSPIHKLRIPLLTKHKMQEIADLVSKSKQAKRESERLLEQAKTRVEQLIEEAVQS